MLVLMDFYLNFWELNNGLGVTQDVQCASVIETLIKLGTCTLQIISYIDPKHAYICEDMAFLCNLQLRYENYDLNFDINARNKLGK